MKELPIMTKVLSKNEPEIPLNLIKGGLRGV